MTADMTMIMRRAARRVPTLAAQRSLARVQEQQHRLANRLVPEPTATGPLPLTPDERWCARCGNAGHASQAYTTETRARATCPVCGSSAWVPAVTVLRTDEYIVGQGG